MPSILLRGSARIRKVYRLFQRRKKEPPGSAEQSKAALELKRSKALNRTVLDAELTQKDLKEKRKKVLNFLDRH